MSLEREQIKRDEGFRSKVYADSEGVLTVGYGRNLESVGVSEEEAEILLDNDLRTAHAECRRRIPVFPYLDSDRQGVLINMMFNLGWPRLSTFKKFLAALDRQDYKEARAQMEDSLWHTQVGARAERLERRMYSRG